MLIAHTADLHLGHSPRDITGRDVERSRIRDFLKNFSTVIQQAEQESAELLIIAGDVFHSPRPRSLVFVEFCQEIGRLLRKGTQVVIVAGNHDIPRARDSVNPLEALQRAGLKGFHYINSRSSVVVKTLSGEKVAIVAVPYIDKRVTMAHGLSEEAVRGAIRKFIKAELDRISADYRILVIHGLVEGAEITPGFDVYSYDLMLTRDDLAFDEFDYVALGHVHKPQQISKNAFYSGSIERIKFSEAEEKKTFLLVELTGGSAKAKEVKLDCRPMVVLPKIGLMRSSEAFDKLMEAIKSVEIPEGSLVLLRIRATKEAWLVVRKKLGELEKFLLERRKVLGFKMEREMAGSSGGGKLERKKRSFEELFEEFMRKKFPFEQKEVLELAIDMGKKLLRGESL